MVGETRILHFTRPSVNRSEYFPSGAIAAEGPGRKSERDTQNIILNELFKQIYQRVCDDRTSECKMRCSFLVCFWRSEYNTIICYELLLYTTEIE